MSYVLLTKEGFRRYEWDGDTRHYVLEPETKQDNTLAMLRMTLHISPDVTLRDLINVVHSDKPLALMVGSYAWNFWMDEFHSAANEDPKPSTFETGDDDPIEYVFIDSWLEFNEEDFTHWVGLHGMSRGGTTYSLSFTPLQNIAHLPVRLVTQTKVLRDHKHVETKDYSFTMLEVLEAVFYEISFYGSPADAEAEGETLRERVAEFEHLDAEGEERSDDGGKPRLRSIDDLFEELREEQKHWDAQICICQTFRLCDCRKKGEHCNACGKRPSTTVH